MTAWQPDCNRLEIVLPTPEGPSTIYDLPAFTVEDEGVRVSAPADVLIPWEWWERLQEGVAYRRRRSL